MKVAEDVYNATGQLIIQKDTILTDKAITRLRFHSIATFKIFEEGAPVFEAAPVDTGSYLTKLRETSEFAQFSGTFTNSVTDFEEVFNRYINDETESSTKVLLNDVKSLLGQCNTGLQVFDLLHCMRESSDQTYTHSINVAIICGVLGSWLGFGKSDIDTLILCGIFHDIGKLTIPVEIIDKPGPLTPDEYALVKTHALKGYNLLQPRKLPPSIAMSAMMHHERCNGSGYPMGLTSDKIDDFAKIVSIADVYDAMTSRRSYREPQSPFEAIHIFETEGLSSFDTKYVMTFIEHITQAYLGSHVQLSDGRVGTLVLLNKQERSKPVIQVGGEYINLASESGLKILKLM